MRGDINQLNLMNGMNYSGSQLSKLAELARKAGEASGAGEAAFDAAAAAKYRDALRGIVDTLERGGEPAPPAIREAAKLRQSLRGKPADPAAIDALVRSAEEILCDSQREVLIGYKACLIPPKNLKDPVRVGQASGTGPAERALELVRRIPEKKWARATDEHVEKMLSRIEEQGGRYPEDEREAAKRSLRRLVDRVRALTDVDFALQKPELAEEVLKFSRKKVLEDEIAAALGPERVLRDKIRAFVLDPRAVPFYEARVEQLKAAATGKPVDLDKITPAPHCKNGGCALKEK